jgi:glycosyltransferase involved in cell wall biosynthesis
MISNGSVVLAPAGYEVSPEYGSDPERPWRLVEGLSRRGIRVTVVARRVTSQSQWSAGVTVRLLPGTMPATPMGRLLDRVRLYRYARRVALGELDRTDVLAVHHMAPCGPASPSLLPRLPVPFVYGPMPNLGAVASPEGWSLWLGTRQASSPQQAAGKLFGQAVTPVARALWRRTMNMADAVTVEAVANVPQERPDAVVIPMGVDLELFSPASVTPVPGRIVSVHALLPRKGTDVLIRAVARVKLQFPTVHAMIAGDGPELERLQQLSTELGVGASVTFLGRVPRQELPKLYQSAAAFCHAARTDTFPMAVLEAMACGIPVLASSAGAFAEMVGTAGLIHPVGSFDVLGDQIGEVLGHQLYRDQLSVAARERAVRVYSIDGMCESYLRLYTELSSLRRNPQRAYGGATIPSGSESTQSPSGAVLRARPPRPK